MEKDASLRYQTAAELEASLKRLKRESPSGHVASSSAARNAGDSGSSAAAVRASSRIFADAQWRLSPMSSVVEEEQVAELARCGRRRGIALAAASFYAGMSDARNADWNIVG